MRSTDVRSTREKKRQYWCTSNCTSSKVIRSKIMAGLSIVARPSTIRSMVGKIQCLAVLPCSSIFRREASANPSIVPSNQVVRTGEFLM